MPERPAVTGAQDSIPRFPSRAPHSGLAVRAPYHRKLGKASSHFARKLRLFAIEVRCVKLDGGFGIGGIEMQMVETRPGEGESPTP